MIHFQLSDTSSIGNLTTTEKWILRDQYIDIRVKYIPNTKSIIHQYVKRKIFIYLGELKTMTAFHVTEC